MHVEARVHKLVCILTTNSLRRARDDGPFSLIRTAIIFLQPLCIGLALQQFPIFLVVNIVTKLADGNGNLVSTHKEDETFVVKGGSH